MRISSSIFLFIQPCFLFILFGSSTCFSFGEKNWVTDLRSSLLSGYNPSARPVKDHNLNTTVKIALSLNDLDLDDRAQIMTAVTYLKIVWNDEFLQWDPSENGNVDRLHFDREEVWMPDIALYNSAESNGVTPSSSLPALSFSNGKMMWVPPFTAEVPCHMDITLWPSDVHTCVLRFGSWAHHGEQLHIQLLGEKPISMNFYEENKRWSVVNYTASNESTQYEDEVYFHTDFKFTVKREAASHAAYVTQTTFAVMIIILGSYLLPLCYHLSRFLLHLFSLSILVTCNFVMFLSLPATGGSIPHVVRYFSGTIIMTTLSLLCNVIMASSFKSNFNLQTDVKKKLGSLLKSEKASEELETSEMAYSSLDEELVEVSQRPAAENTESHRNDRKKTLSTESILRLLNGVLFVMFSLAYIIDYSVMRSTIGY